jgi:hypothetical protein
VVNFRKEETMTDREPKIEAGQEFTVDLFRPEDAPGVARLFREVYGEDYPIKLVYDPAQLTDSYHAGDNIPLVARTASGDVVGHEAFYRSAASRRTYELGQGLILPSYRQLGIPARLQEYACEKMAPSMDIDVVFGEAVCNQIYMQKSWAMSRTVATALEVDLMPAEAYTKEQSASGRVAALLMFRTFRPRPHTVYMPERYGEALEFIYKDMDDGRTLSVSPARAKPVGPATSIAMQIFDFARVARLAVHQGGEDFPATFEAEECHALARGTVVVQVWLRLSWPWVGGIVDYLKGKGYFFGGALIQWFGDDGILMQKIFGTPSWEGIQLYSDRAKKLMDYVKDDWEKGGI